MNDEVVRADPVLRKRAVAMVLGAGVVGAAAIQWGLPWLELARLRQPGMQRTICMADGPWRCWTRPGGPPGR
jgi:hypothetical protein